MSKKTIIFSIILLLTFFSVVFTAEGADYPSPEGYVNDFAKVLSSELKYELDVLFREVENKTGAEISVVTVKTTQPESIERYAVGLFEKWGLGKKGKDNGIMILLAVKDRKTRIEVGYGLEGVVTDLDSRLIINDLMVPSLKKGEYDMAVASASAMIARMLANEYNVKYEIAPGVKMPKARARKTSPVGGLLTFILFVLIFGFRFGTLFFITSSGGGYWSGGGRGSFGGGFGGFGGGMSGGGGASGSW